MVDENGYESDDGASGMTLRQWYAGQALKALEDPKDEWFQKLSPQDQADLRSIWSFQQADSMLKEGAK